MNKDLKQKVLGFYEDEAYCQTRFLKRGISLEPRVKGLTAAIICKILDLNAIHSSLPITLKIEPKLLMIALERSGLKPVKMTEEIEFYIFKHYPLKYAYAFTYQYHKHKGEKFGITYKPYLKFVRDNPQHLSKVIDHCLELKSYYLVNNLLYSLCGVPKTDMEFGEYKKEDAKLYVQVRRVLYEEARRLGLSMLMIDFASYDRTPIGRFCLIDELAYRQDFALTTSIRVIDGNEIPHRLMCNYDEHMDELWEPEIKDGKIDIGKFDSKYARDNEEKLLNNFPDKLLEFITDRREIERLRSELSLGPSASINSTKERTDFRAALQDLIEDRYIAKFIEASRYGNFDIEVVYDFISKCKVNLPYNMDMILALFIDYCPTISEDFCLSILMRKIKEERTDDYLKNLLVDICILRMCQVLREMLDFDFGKHSREIRRGMKQVPKYVYAAYKDILNGVYDGEEIELDDGDSSRDHPKIAIKRDKK